MNAATRTRTSFFHTVMRGERSRENKRRWHCELGCGHTQTVYAERLPKKAHYLCCRIVQRDVARAAEQEKGP